MSFEEWADQQHIADPLVRYAAEKAWKAAQKQILLDTVFAVDSIAAKCDETKIKADAKRQKLLLM